MPDHDLFDFGDGARRPGPSPAGPPPGRDPFGGDPSGQGPPGHGRGRDPFGPGSRGPGRPGAYGVSGVPMSLLLGALLAGVAGAVVAVLAGVGGVALAFAGWVLAGPAAIGLTALHVHRTTRLRAQGGVYTERRSTARLYAVTVVVALAGVVLSALRIADWAGRL